MFIWKVGWQRSHLPSLMHWFTPPNSCNSQANAQIPGTLHWVSYTSSRIPGSCSITHARHWEVEWEAASQDSNWQSKPGSLTPAL